MTLDDAIAAGSKQVYDTGTALGLYIDENSEWHLFSLEDGCKGLGEPMLVITTSTIIALCKDGFHALVDRMS